MVPGCLSATNDWSSEAPREPGCRDSAATCERLVHRDRRCIAGAYAIVGEIGAGGMGVVHLAERLADGEHVAVKLMRPAFAGDATLRERLRREAEAVRRVQHPNVVALLDAGDAGALGPYLVFEHLEGESLSTRVAGRGRMSLASALDVLDGVLAALEAAHAAGVVHRDLKPSNIFLATEAGCERAKVLDFGISRILSDAADAPAMRLTRTGLVVGTPAYMAPEQALGDAGQDHRVDLYSAGVVLYELLAGALPHTGENCNQLLAHVLQRDAVALTERNATIDPALSALVHRAIAREPAARFATAAEFRAALVAWRAEFATRAECITQPAFEVSAPAIIAPAAERPTTLERLRPAAHVALSVADEAVAAAPSATSAPPSRAPTHPWHRPRRLDRVLVALCAALLGGTPPVVSWLAARVPRDAVAHAPRAPDSGEQSEGAHASHAPLGHIAESSLSALTGATRGAASARPPPAVRRVFAALRRRRLARAAPRTRPLLPRTFASAPRPTPFGWWQPRLARR